MIRYVFLPDAEEKNERLYQKFKDYYESQMEEPFDDSQLVIGDVQFKTKADMLKAIQRHYQISKGPALYRFKGHLGDMIPDWYERDSYYQALEQQIEQLENDIKRLAFCTLPVRDDNHLPVCPFCHTVLDHLNIDDPLCPKCNSQILCQNDYLSGLYVRLDHLKNLQEEYINHDDAMDLRCLTFIEEDWD